MPKALVLALGTFDGLHLGHRALIKRGLELARDYNLSSACYTFTNVPVSFSLGLSNIQLMSSAHKAALLKELGIEVLIMEDFNEILMNTEPEDFVRGLISKYRIARMIVGKDFRFGRGGQGSSTVLKSLGEKYGYQTEIIDFIYDDEGKLSSSRLRARLREGDMEGARHILGRNFSFRSPIVRGESPEISSTCRYVMRPNFDITPIKSGLYRALLIADGFKEIFKVRVLASLPPSMWELEFSYDGALDLDREYYELEFLEALDEGLE